MTMLGTIMLVLAILIVITDFIFFFTAWTAPEYIDRVVSFVIFFTIMMFATCLIITFV